MTKKKDYEKVLHTIKATDFLGLSVVSLDIETLNGALEYQFSQGVATGREPT